MSSASAVLSTKQDRLLVAISRSFWSTRHKKGILKRQIAIVYSSTVGAEIL